MTGWSWLTDEENDALDRWFESDNPEPLMPLFEAVKQATPECPAALQAVRLAALLDRLEAETDGSDTSMENQLNDAGFGSAGII